MTVARVHESKLLEATPGVYLKIKKSKMVFLPSLRSLLAAIVAVHVGALQNGMIMTPPMGWSSWNKFHCGINENLIRNITDAIVSSKLAAAGYDHINLDGLLGCIVLGLFATRHLPMGFAASNLIFVLCRLLDGQRAHCERRLAGRQKELCIRHESTGRLHTLQKAAVRSLSRSWYQNLPGPPRFF